MILLNLLLLYHIKHKIAFLFHITWEQRKLYEVADFNPKSELPEVFEYVDLESVVGTEMISHRTETKDTAPSRAQRLAQKGDVFFQTVRPYQRNNYLFEKPDNNYVFSTGYAQMRPKIDATFLMSFLQTDSFVNVVLDNCTGTSYPAINSNDLSNLEISLPVSMDEQRRIGSFITNLDNLITLHQCKEKKMYNLYIETCSGICVDHTHFWEQRKFASVFDGLQNNTLSRADLNYESGTVKNVHYGDVLIKFGDYIDAAETELPYISDDTKVDKFKNSFLQDGDIVIADTAEDDTVGKCTEIQGSEGLKLLSGLHTIACRPKEKYGPMFLGYYINSPAYHNQLKPLMQGIKVTSISKSALQDTDMIVPKSIEEQSKIGEYLSNLDNLITLHQRGQFC